jgi:heat shock protein beta
MCYLQPESPAEFGAKVYEMMSLALAGKSEGAIEEPSTGDAEVIEASEVITENDPWKS